MLGSALKTFIESLTDDQSIDSVLLYQLINIAKTRIEEERNWKILEVEDTSESAGTGNTFLSMKTLPTDFGNDIGLFVAETGGVATWYQPIPYSRRYSYKDSSRRYYIDLANSQYALTGKMSVSQTIHLIYRKTSTTITSTVEWVFPDRFHPLLGFLVAEMYKAGTDYDSISFNQAIQHRLDSKMLWEALQEWDTALRTRELNNQYSGLGSTDPDGQPIGGSSDVDLASL